MVYADTNQVYQDCFLVLNFQVILLFSILALDMYRTGIIADKEHYKEQ